MRQKQIRNFLLLSMSFLILALFFKPYHSHACSHSTNSPTASDHHSSGGHADEKQSDCGNECACPQHRVNGCSPFTALAKTDRLDLLEVIASNEVEASFSAKQSPVLDGPFQPPRA